MSAPSFTFEKLPPERGNRSAVMAGGCCTTCCCCSCCYLAGAGGIIGAMLESTPYAEVNYRPTKSTVQATGMPQQGTIGVRTANTGGHVVRVSAAPIVLYWILLFAMPLFLNPLGLTSKSMTGTIMIFLGTLPVFMVVSFGIMMILISSGVFGFKYSGAYSKIISRITSKGCIYYFVLLPVTLFLLMIGVRL